MISLNHYFGSETEYPTKDTPFGAAGSYIAQPAKAACDSGGNTPYGRGCISQEANPNNNAKGFGGAVSSLATGPGIGDIRASGCGANQFSTTSANGHDNC
jgi:hypothetical protein